MEYIYARISTDKQTVESQLQTFKDRYPNAEIVDETISGAAINKPQLELLLARLQRGDTLVIAGLDRLGRRAWKAIKLIEDLCERGIVLISAREGVDFSTPAGKLVASCLLAVAEMERQLLSDRTKAGMARVKSEGQKQIGRRAGAPINNKKPLGRKRTITDDMRDDIKLLKQKGVQQLKIAELLDCSPSTVCEILKVG